MERVADLQPALRLAIQTQALQPGLENRRPLALEPALIGDALSSLHLTG